MMLRLYWLIFLALGVPFSSVWAQDEAPRHGEIALEGRVITIDSVQNTFVLRVGAFSNPGGKRASLAAPKDRVVSLWSETQIRASAGGRRLKLTDLMKNQQVSAVGPNTDATLFVARVVFVKTSLSNSPASEKSESKRPEKPPLKTANRPILPLPVEATPLVLGAPFTLGKLAIEPFDVGFDSGKRLFPNQAVWKIRPVYFCAFRVTGPAPIHKAPDGASPYNPLFRVRRLIGPQGQLVANAEIADFGARGNSKGEIALRCSDVDPAWEYVVADLDITQPDAPLDSDGNSTSQITVSDVEIPTTRSGEISLDQEFTTPLGTKITLDKIRFPGADAADKDPIFVVRHQATRPIQDAVLSGFSLSVKGGGRATGGLHYGREPVAEEEVTYGPLADGKLTFTFSVTESVPVYQNRDSIRRVRLKLPVAATLLTQPPVMEADQLSPLLAQAEGANVRAIVEGDGLGSNEAFEALLWVETPDLAATGGSVWRITEKGSKALPDEGGDPVPLTFFDMTAWKFLWHSDGAPHRPNEFVQFFISRISDKTQTFSLDLELEKRLTLDFWSHWDEVPIPTRNEDNVRPALDDEVFAIRKIQRFDSTTELDGYPGWLGSWRESGMVVVVEYFPTRPGSDLVVQALEAEDNRGRPLKLAVFGDHLFRPGDFTEAGNVKSTIFSLVMSTPAPDATSFRLWTHAAETSTNPQTTHLVLKNIANPNFKK